MRSSAYINKAESQKDEQNRTEEEKKNLQKSQPRKYKNVFYSILCSMKDENVKM